MADSVVVEACKITLENIPLILQKSNLREVVLYAKLGEYVIHRIGDTRFEIVSMDYLDTHWHEIDSNHGDGFFYIEHN